MTLVTSSSTTSHQCARSFGTAGSRREVVLAHPAVARLCRLTALTSVPGPAQFDRRRFMSSPLCLKRTCCPAAVRALLCLFALILLAGTASAQFVSPPSGQYQLNGCRNTGTITLPSTNNAEGGGFVCPDAAYTSGNLGKGWNELDLVPFRLTTVTSANASITTYNIIVAGEYTDSGHLGWDVIASDVDPSSVGSNSFITGPTKNPNSDSSCSAKWNGFFINGPGLSGSDTSIYRTLQVHQNPGTTCIWDYYMRLALGAHLYPGSSL